MGYKKVNTAEKEHRSAQQSNGISFFVRRFFNYVKYILYFGLRSTVLFIRFYARSKCTEFVF